MAMTSNRVDPYSRPGGPRSLTQRYAEFDRLADEIFEQKETEEQPRHSGCIRRKRNIRDFI